MMKIKKYFGKKILVLGLGVNQGGVGVVKFFANQGAQIRVTDIRSKEELAESIAALSEIRHIEYSLGGHKFEDIDWADVVVRNPAVKPGSEYLKYAKEEGREIVTDLSLFLDIVDQKKIIAVTGTKGKSTTATLIYKILQDASFNVVFAGNIGKSVLDTLPYLTADSRIILEVSSFQLDNLEDKYFSPHIAVITNITPDHLNYHESLKDYIDAKRKISKQQLGSDYLFLNANDVVTTSAEFLNDLRAKICFYDFKNLPQDLKPNLKGVHNLANIAAALAVVKKLGVDEKQALISAEKFEGVEFRMQLIEEINGLKIINDSAATNPNAAILALETFPNCILIAGGMNKGLDYNQFAQTINKLAKSVYLIEGDASENLRLRIEKSKLKGVYNNFINLLEDIKPDLESGDTILFSPGATSFNLFLNEFDRGRKFNQAVESVFNE